MKNTEPVQTSFERACFQVTALARARLLRRDLSAELRRLQHLPRSRSYLEVGGFLAALLALSVIAASLGWVAFGAFFLIVIVVFR